MMSKVTGKENLVSNENSWLGLEFARCMARMGSTCSLSCIARTGTYRYVRQNPSSTIFDLLRSNYSSTRICVLSQRRETSVALGEVGLMRLRGMQPNQSLQPTANPLRGLSAAELGR